MHNFQLNKIFNPNIFAWLQFIFLYEEILFEKTNNKKNKIPYSIILLEIKNWDSEKDLDHLVNKIDKIEKEGLYWKKEYKLEEIAFEIKKNILTLIVDDDKISIDELIDQIESWENEIQSVDILSFKEL